MASGNVGELWAAFTPSMGAGGREKAGLRKYINLSSLGCRGTLEE